MNGLSAAFLESDDRENMCGRYEVDQISPIRSRS